LNYSRIISVAGNYEQTTANVIPSDSCHPQEHTLAAIKYLTKRMETYNFSEEKQHNTTNIIQ
jgi:hypothetical protein